MPCTILSRMMLYLLSGKQASYASSDEAIKDLLVIKLCNPSFFASLPPHIAEPFLASVNAHPAVVSPANGIKNAVYRTLSFKTNAPAPTAPSPARPEVVETIVTHSIPAKHINATENTEAVDSPAKLPTSGQVVQQFSCPSAIESKNLICVFSSLCCPPFGIIKPPTVPPCPPYIVSIPKIPSIRCPPILPPPPPPPPTTTRRPTTTTTPCPKPITTTRRPIVVPPKISIATPCVPNVFRPPCPVPIISPRPPEIDKIDCSEQPCPPKINIQNCQGILQKLLKPLLANILCIIKPV